uniref:Putative secreted protein n=1 Tax=Ixodes ricinus TaxID=34613 RepID=A0A147BNK0_IXORI
MTCFLSRLALAKPLFCWTSLPTASRALCNSSLFQSSCLCASLELVSSSSSWPHRTSMLSSFPFVAPSSSFSCEAICSASCNFSVEACNCASSSLPWVRRVSRSCSQRCSSLAMRST